MKKYFYHLIYLSIITVLFLIIIGSSSYNISKNTFLGSFSSVFINTNRHYLHTVGMNKTKCDVICKFGDSEKLDIFKNGKLINSVPQNIEYAYFVVKYDGKTLLEESYDKVASNMDITFYFNIEKIDEKIECKIFIINERDFRILRND